MLSSKEKKTLSIKPMISCISTRPTCAKRVLTFMTIRFYNHLARSNRRASSVFLPSRKARPCVRTRLIHFCFRIRSSLLVLPYNRSLVFHLNECLMRWMILGSGSMRKCLVQTSILTLKAVTTNLNGEATSQITKALVKFPT